MKTRTMTIALDQVTVEGAAWSRQPLQLVLCEYENAEIVKRVRVELRPVDVEELATKLWEVREKYAKAVKDITEALRAPNVSI